MLPMKKIAPMKVAGVAKESPTTASGSSLPVAPTMPA